MNRHAFTVASNAHHAVEARPCSHCKHHAIGTMTGYDFAGNAHAVELHQCRATAQKQPAFDPIAGWIEVEGNLGDCCQLNAGGNCARFELPEDIAEDIAWLERLHELEAR